MSRDGGEFRFRLGSLVVPHPSGHLDLLALGGLIGRSSCDAFLETAAHDLVSHEDVRHGLERAVPTVAVGGE